MNSFAYICLTTLICFSCFSTEQLLSAEKVKTPGFIRSTEQMMIEAARASSKKTASSEQPPKRLIAAPVPGNVIVDNKPQKAISFRNALQRAQAGDEILLMPGNYEGQIEIDFNGPIDAPLTIKPLIPQTVTISCKDIVSGMKNTKSFAILFSDAKHIKLDGLQFKNCPNHSVLFSNASHIHLENIQYLQSVKPKHINGVSTDITLTHE